MFISPDLAIQKIKNHQIVAIPTETVYGLAGLATSQIAIQKIYQAKNRPADNPLICHFHTFTQIQDYCLDIPPWLPILIDNFSPGPLSYLLKIPENSLLLSATRSRKTAVCRIPAHPLALSIIQAVGSPLAAPSANTSGKTSPTTAQMVRDDLGEKIDGIVDGGNTQEGLESTIIDCQNPEQISILRPGVIGAIELKKVLKNTPFENLPIIYNQPTNDLVIPGNKYRHYAPNKKIMYIPNFLQLQSVISNFIIENPFIKTDAQNQKIAIFATLKEIDSLKSKFTKVETDRLCFINLGQDAKQVASMLYYNLYQFDRRQDLSFGVVTSLDFGASSSAIAVTNRLKRILAL